MSKKTKSGKRNSKLKVGKLAEENRQLSSEEMKEVQGGKTQEAGFSQQMALFRLQQAVNRDSEQFQA